MAYCNFVHANKLYLTKRIENNKCPPEKEELYYPSSENKGADQLRGYREADLRLCFRICRLLVFLCGGSIIILVSHGMQKCTY